jgi:hypothetical protein
VRTDRIDQAGVITLRVAGSLHHIGVGRTYTGTRVLILVQDLHITIVNAATGELLRQLTLRSHQGLPAHLRPQGPQTEQALNRIAGSELFRCLETSHGRADTVGLTGF